MFNKKSDNERLTEIDNTVDKLIKNDYMNTLMDQYSHDLNGYEFIDTVEQFSLLYLKGSMKYINKFDKKLRYGGLLIKIYQKGNEWYSIIKKINGKKYYVSFKLNYIFYCKNKFNNNLSMFISDIDNNKYEII
jgi:hypothetical protein